LRFRVFRVEDLQGLRFRVYGLWFRVWDLRFRVFRVEDLQGFG
jgi:TRAP-type mannitol/chloroaromatic compound transport system substrate-binding protein